MSSTCTVQTASIFGAQTSSLRGAQTGWAKVNERLPATEQC